MKRFIIDSSSLIHFEEKYPYDILPTLWDEVFKLFEANILFSVREVYEELEDSQQIWKDYEEYFRELTEEESDAMNKILTDERFEVFKINGMKEDGPWADPHLIACAMVNETVSVVSQENLNRNPKRKIAFVCKECGIPYMDFLEFLREANVKI
ncbi:protein of unknown function [Methanobrevibacter olleyae]|uniref:DUF4411 family protein n=1 Tax=Methanobrevibacter olleyae TaxID=294671 RepID=A0A1I4H9F3_METOL|nr:DUF4411 family protein [Methanobrevibacter olleyae]SFL38041.1 protein of unknown function [Methanobrevibacter olleyae]